MNIPISKLKRLQRQIKNADPEDIPEPISSSIFSQKTWGIDDTPEWEEEVKDKKARKFYRRNGVKIYKLPCWRKSQHARYQEEIIPPVWGWYPSKTANFVFEDTEKLDLPMHLIGRIPAFFNPAIWKHSTSGRYVLRVPRDRKGMVWDILYRLKFWYNPNDNLWRKRKYTKRRHIHGSRQSLLSWPRRRSPNKYGEGVWSRRRKKDLLCYRHKARYET